MNRKTILLVALSTLGLATPAGAHDAWFLPSITVLSDTNQSVTVDAGMSTAPFQANHAAMNIDGVKVWQPDGTMGAIENAARGRYRSTFDVKIDKPGTWRIGTESTNVTGTFKVDGEEWSIGRRRGPAAAAGSANVAASVADIPANATDLDLRERLSRNEFFVTAGAPNDTALAPAGKGLELVAITPPTDLVSDEPGQFQFLVDGKPAAGLTVEVVPGGQRYREEELAQELTTDAEGKISVEWPIAGFYWLNATLTDDKPSFARAKERQMSYVATLEVVAP